MQPTRSVCRHLTTCALLASGAAMAQLPIPEPRQVRVERNYPYSESVSRELFAACDANSDDRLDVFETADAIESLRNPRDSKTFARIDTDRDGFVTWPEFDQLFKSGASGGGRFRVFTCRDIAPAPPPQPATPLQQFLQLHDADGDGCLSPAEVDRLADVLGLPPGVAEALRAQDLDRSGKLGETELAAWFQALPAAVTAGDKAAASSLPEPWRDVDRDRNGAIDLEELRQMLRRIDPGLLRWASELLARSDGNGDGKLAPTELSTATGRTDASAPAAGQGPPQR